MGGLEIELKENRDSEAKAPEPTGPTYELRTDLYTTDDGTVVEAGDPEAMYLYASAGDEIPADDAEKFGLTEPATKGEPEVDQDTSSTAPSEDTGGSSPEAPSAPEAPEVKQAPAPENKQAPTPENKSA